MPKWIHDRADHIRAKNPEMPKSQAFAIATQQAYATGKQPKAKSWGTREGKIEAHQKYDAPKSAYKKTADPSHKTKIAMNLSLWKGFVDELTKISMPVVGASKKLFSQLPTAVKIPKTPAATSAMSAVKPKMTGYSSTMPKPAKTTVTNPPQVGAAGMQATSTPTPPAGS